MLISGRAHVLLYGLHIARGIARDGGGVAVVGESGSFSFLNAKKTFFYDNYALRGGAISTVRTFTRITSLQAENNYAQTNGGGIAILHGNLFADQMLAQSDGCGVRDITDIAGV